MAHCRDLGKPALHRTMESAGAGNGFPGPEHALSPCLSEEAAWAEACAAGDIFGPVTGEAVFPGTEEIIRKAGEKGMSGTGVERILNLKRAWAYILSPEVRRAESSYEVLCRIAARVQGAPAEEGKIRTVHVRIGGSTYRPPLPDEEEVRKCIRGILQSGQRAIDLALDLCLYVMRTQVFADGNKRTAMIYANHYLIARGQGYLGVPRGQIPAFHRHLVRYYESGEKEEIKAFLKRYCWRRRA